MVDEEVSAMLVSAGGWLEELTQARPEWKWSFVWDYLTAMLTIIAKQGELRFCQDLHVSVRERVTTDYLLRELDLEAAVLKWAKEG